MKLKTFFLFFIFLFCVVLGLSGVAQASNVLVVEITDTIDQATVELVQISISEAERRNAELIVLLLDTPGGGVAQTFEIADIIWESDIPFAGFVYPTGSAAWSAGTFILLSTHVAAMAPHTIIGSAQPVEIGLEGTRMINDSKTINALVGWLEERADLYGRNRSFVNRFITENVNINGSEAVEVGVIEAVASTPQELLTIIDGMQVNTSQGMVTLSTADAEIIEFAIPLHIQLAKLIGNPVLTSLLLVLGIFALIFGLQAPGFGAEVFGVIAILLSLIGSGFSISVLGFIFIIMGFILLIIEVFVLPGFGVVGIGGTICLIIGSLFLIPTYTTRDWLISMDYIQNAVLIVLVLIILIGAFFVFLLYKILQIRDKKSVLGKFSGEYATTVEQITPDKTGFVRYKGEYWQAKSDTVIEPKTKVEIVDKDETVLIVKPKRK